MREASSAKVTSRTWCGSRPASARGSAPRTWPGDLLGGEADDRVDGLDGRLPGCAVGAAALDPDGLDGMREERTRLDRADLRTADLTASVRPVTGAVSERDLAPGQAPQLAAEVLLVALHDQDAVGAAGGDPLGVAGQIEPVRQRSGGGDFVALGGDGGAAGRRSGRTTCQRPLFVIRGFDNLDQRGSLSPAPDRTWGQPRHVLTRSARLAGENGPPCPLVEPGADRGSSRRPGRTRDASTLPTPSTTSSSWPWRRYFLKSGAVACSRRCSTQPRLPRPLPTLGLLLAQVGKECATPA